MMGKERTERAELDGRAKLLLSLNHDAARGSAVRLRQIALPFSTHYQAPTGSVAHLRRFLKRAIPPCRNDTRSYLALYC